MATERHAELFSTGSSTQEDVEVGPALPVDVDEMINYPDLFPNNAVDADREMPVVGEVEEAEKGKRRGQRIHHDFKCCGGRERGEW